MLRKIGLFTLISLTIYLGIAAGLILSDRPQPDLATAGESLSFDVLISVNYAKMPELQPYTARDGASLYYRLYESSTPTVKKLVLLHGSGWHSMQFYLLARYLSEQGAATVITPDLRGHGFNPERCGDVDYVGQLEDDLADLIEMLRKRYPNADVVVGGHSSGGGLAIRFAGSKHGAKSDAISFWHPS